MRGDSANNPDAEETTRAEEELSLKERRKRGGILPIKV